MEPGYIYLTAENIGAEHLCCAMADKKSAAGVADKKAWLGERFADGLRFVKADVRGKVFIEYLPADAAWMPVEAPGYMLIDCHWVAGSHKGQGHGARLLAICERDAAGMNSVVVVVGKKKKPFLSDKAFYLKHGYEVCDSAEPGFELLVKRFCAEAPLPRFRECAREGLSDETRGIDIFHTAQCPFTTVYVDLIRPVAEASPVPVRIHRIASRGEAQRHACPVTTYSVFVDGKFHTQEILTLAKLEKLIGGLS